MIQQHDICQHNQSLYYFIMLWLKYSNTERELGPSRVHQFFAVKGYFLFSIAEVHRCLLPPCV